MAHLRTRIRQAGQPVHRLPGAEDLKNIRNRPLPGASEVEEVDNTSEIVSRKVQAYTTIEVESTKGKKYRITVPASYVANIPKVWTWNERRLRAAELLAIGYPVSQVVEDPEVGINSRHIIYSWLQHPEFKEHVDALVLETGFASQRERIAGLSRLTQKLFNRILNDADNIPMTDKSIGALITGVMQGMKQLAQEKGEFVEQQQIAQTTQHTGSIVHGHANITDLLKGATDDERKALEAEFDKMGDDLIRSITGGKD